LSRQKLLQVKTEEAPREPAGDKRDEKHDDASAVEEQESDVAGESAKEDRQMKDNGRCHNYNHGRADAPVRFCPMCGEVVNRNISKEVCSEEKHAGRRPCTNTYCMECGEQLIQ